MKQTGVDAADYTVDQIEGRHPVLEALRAGLPVTKVMLAGGLHGSIVGDLREAAARRGVPLEETERHNLDRMAVTGAHQGVIALLPSFKYASLSDLLARLPEGLPPGLSLGSPQAPATAPLFLMLDGIQDPGNLGAMIRSAASFQAWGVIIRERRQAGVTPRVAKASAGTLAWVPVCQVNNLGRAADELQQRGLWLIGASPDAGTPVHELDLTLPSVILIGGEERGLSSSLARRLDFIGRIPMAPAVASLNASAAAAIFLYEVYRQRIMLT
ncbi:MAG: 23S rRNA (guanosine(2251)-2'-O)-methyltransferase RlmB [Firmicutes bacterium]|nr:23S rRNA (guanosine(2251)-2'-O)-methyltransferase RlmB [Bacillota bacterium]